MTNYESYAYSELTRWQKEMMRRPGMLADLPKAVQNRINRAIPQKVHKVITKVFEQMTRFLLSGADLINVKPVANATLEEREEKARQLIDRYTNAATAEGALTGAGGILWGLADLPLWLSIKLKMLAHLGSVYGHDTAVFSERFYIIHILEITFSSKAHRREVYQRMRHWHNEAARLGEDKDNMDWYEFQQQYRDYLDIAKLLQLIPGIGAVVGATVNRRHTRRLGEYAMNAYRMRWFDPDSAIVKT